MSGSPQGGDTKIWISLGSCTDTCSLLIVVSTQNTWGFYVLGCHLSTVSESPKEEQVWTTPVLFAVPTSSCLGISRILGLSRESLTQAHVSVRVCVCPGLPLKPLEFQQDPCSAPPLKAPWQLDRCPQLCCTQAAQGERHLRGQRGLGYP